MMLDATPPETLNQFTELCGVLADPGRLRVLLLLARDREASVSQLQTVLGIPQSTVSFHLGPLRWHGLVTFRPDKRMHFYSLTERVTAADNSLEVDGGGLRVAIHVRPAAATAKSRGGFVRPGNGNS